MYEMLEQLTDMEGTPETLEKLDQLGRTIKDTALCGLGQTAPNPVLSTMNFFREEYEAYAYRTKKTSYTIDADKCIGCTACKRVCPVDCITGDVKQIHVIDEDVCIACGACYDKCKFDAIIRP
jgi:NAD-dependent dihydropyrimidine dehydrogenase PreA subunit